MSSSLKPSERNRLVEDHIDTVHAAANRLKVTRRVRDELLSAGFEALVRASRRYDPQAEASFSTFAFRPVMGSMFDCLAGYSRWSTRHRSIDADDSTTFPLPSLTTPDPERQALTAQVLAAVEELPPLARDIIKTHFLQEEKLATVGNGVGLSKTRTSVHLARAIQLLRNKLDDRFAAWPTRPKAAKRRHSSETKEEALRRAQAPSANVARVARELNIAPATIHTWLKPVRQVQPDGAAASADGQARRAS